MHIIIQDESNSFCSSIVAFICSTTSLGSIFKNCIFLFKIGIITRTTVKVEVEEFTCYFCADLAELLTINSFYHSAGTLFVCLRGAETQLSRPLIQFNNQAPAGLQASRTGLRCPVSTAMDFAHLSSLMTSTKWASLFSLKFLARRWISAEWSIPVPAVPVPAARPTLVPVPVLVLLFFSFSWRMSHRELWLALTGSSTGGLRRPLAARYLRPGMSWTDVKAVTKKKRTGLYKRKRMERKRSENVGVSENRVLPLSCWPCALLDSWEQSRHHLALLLTCSHSGKHGETKEQQDIDKMKWIVNQQMDSTSTVVAHSVRCGHSFVIFGLNYLLKNGVSAWGALPLSFYHPYPYSVRVCVAQ